MTPEQGAQYRYQWAAWIAENARDLGLQQFRDDQFFWRAGEKIYLAAKRQDAARIDCLAETITALEAQLAERGEPVAFRFKHDGQGGWRYSDKPSGCPKCASYSQPLYLAPPAQPASAVVPEWSPVDVYHSLTYETRCRKHSARRASA